MKGSKAKARLEARRKAYDSSSIKTSDAFHRPGSMKKPMPLGKKS